MHYGAACERVRPRRAVRLAPPAPGGPAFLPRCIYFMHGKHARYFSSKVIMQQLYLRELTALARACFIWLLRVQGECRG
eukprot:XP_001696042.1 predicted protein [Chlamydomonas reinhardtii]